MRYAFDDALQECKCEADINNALLNCLRELNQTINMLSGSRISPTHALIELAEQEGELTQRELTEQLGIQPGATSDMLARLEDEGYIARTPSQTDRRTTDVLLTERGNRMAQEAMCQRTLRQAEMFSCLSEDERTILQSLLEKLNADWQRRYPRQSARGHESRRI